MKRSNLLIIGALFFLAFSCGSGDYDDYYYEDDYYGEAAYYEDYDEEGYPQDMAYPESAPAPENYNNGAYSNNTRTYASQTNTRGNGNVINHAIKDQNGMTVANIPLPANWKISGNAIKGPGGSILQDYKGGTMMLQQSNITSIDQLIQEKILPVFRANNVRLKNIIDLPQIAQNDRETSKLYWSVAPTQKTHQVKGLECIDEKGKPTLVVIHYTLSRSQYGSFYGYYYNGLSSTNSQYESAKKAVIYALANMKPTQQAVAMHNQKEQQKSNASWAVHNKKMRDNQAHFDAMNKIHNDTYNSISDMSMDSWRKRNAISDRMQEKAVDGIWERENRTNPYGGGQMKVNSGYQYYYMNNNGQYFGTNDPNYNPSTDPSMNHLEWRKISRPNSGY